MKFKINDIILPKTLYLTEPIVARPEYFLTTDLHNLDREGYQLLPIEQEYYKASSLSLTHTEVARTVAQGEDGWFAVTQTWFDAEQLDQYCFLDHSFCVFRMGFDGEAKKQLQYWADRRPELRRLLAIKPKMGIDFCLDYIDNHEALELIHLEWDYPTREEFLRHKRYLEDVIINKDWDIYIKWVKETKSIWKEMMGEEQGNYKAQKFGLDKALRLVKTF